MGTPVNLIDSTSLVGGYGQIISNWELDDDRIFKGVVSGLDSADPSLVSVFFTLKIAPQLPDADCVLQKKVTQTNGPAGVITAVGGNFVNVLVHVYAGDYQGLVNAGQIYFWDFRGVTTLGSTITLATGMVQFQQNVTQTYAGGVPPVPLPNSGLPRFRGFLTMHPILIPNFAGIFNQGDYYRNALAASANPSGWVCVFPCTDGTGFRTDGIIGDDESFIPGSPFNITPPRFLGYRTAPPPFNGDSGPFFVGDWYRNIPTSGAQPSGWVCTQAGSATTSVWRTDGIVGDN